MDSTTTEVIVAMIGLAMAAVAATRFVMVRVLDSFTLVNSAIVKNQEGMIARTLEEFSETRVVLRSIETNMTVNTEILRNMREEQKIDRVTAVAVAAVVAATAKSTAADVARVAVEVAKT